jgi:outer membrane protein OmpA-like peptidoglycan-associated protein
MKVKILSFLTASLVVTGCATKKYVTTEVGAVNTKVDGLSGQVETTQERVSANERRIDETSQRVDAGIREVRATSEQALTKASEAERAARGKLVYTVTLSDDKVRFPHNKAQISDEARKIIDDAVLPLKEENRGVFFEIEGHTDSTGPDGVNHVLGQQRALAVRDYLHDQVGVALHRMQVISYGDSAPVVDNKTRENRAQNRRVVIKVLE